MKFHFLKLILLSILIFLNKNIIAQSVSLEWVKSMGGTSKDCGKDITTDNLGNIYSIRL